MEKEGVVIETSLDKKFVKAINMIKEYDDKRKFSIDEIATADKMVNINPTKQEDIGGLCISTYNKVLRWILRGDTLCDVIIPEGEKVYECTTSKNCPHGVFVANKIILTNPRTIDDNLVLDLYEKSDLPWKSYFQILPIIALRGFEKSCDKIINDKVTKDNKNEALEIYCSFLNLKEDEKVGIYKEIEKRIRNT